MWDFDNDALELWVEMELSCGKNWVFPESAAENVGKSELACTMRSPIRDTAEGVRPCNQSIVTWSGSCAGRIVTDHAVRSTSIMLVHSDNYIVWLRIGM